MGIAPRSTPGLVAEWLCSGLQIRVCRFDSGPGLHRLRDIGGPCMVGNALSKHRAFAPGAYRAGVRLLIRGSSAVEQSAVNRSVAGSNPAPGANSGPLSLLGAAL